MVTLAAPVNWKTLPLKFSRIKRRDAGGRPLESDTGVRGAEIGIGQHLVGAGCLIKTTSPGASVYERSSAARSAIGAPGVLPELRSLPGAVVYWPPLDVLLSM